MYQKHKWAAIFMTLLLAVVLTACGSSSDKDSSKEKEDATKTVTDTLDRKIEIPTTPKRIVALQNVSEMEILGVKPVGTLDYYITTYPEATKGTESVGNDKPNIEKIASLKPDLIVISDYQKDLLENLEKVAPVYITHFGDTSDKQLSNMANLLNKKAEKEKWDKDYAAASKEAKATLKDAGVENEKAAVIQFYGKEIYIHDAKVFDGLFSGAGFTPTDEAKANHETKAISSEAIPSYAKDADRLFILMPTDGNDDSINEMLKGVWKDIPAVQKNQVYKVDNTKWSDYSASAQLYQMEDTVKQITGK
ncbi:ABC transporter substrate-binding protein [Listeria seeligeri]|uniref:ABC transporter substrate-binding protein n=1 Tax=Listeria seeligeri TaxID=1640 RepID=UPI0016249C42|nr:ABC transporter substrate-binding protein [Listeria seeligeri]MBC1814990.1 ABC transporter substrate-binding protein [Listeria seeligeri]MBC2029370.1 ABC transporter substrate-binding protein [Listeria seeligeri]MBC6113828.1 ABC transporter substrate-binding protein [Listeria seeligeri]MBC6159928.1 ABC transporter substrate-binding protein [Listeria seeligeri]